MSSNFPIIPIGTKFPSAPADGSEVLDWARGITFAVQQLYRRISSALLDGLGATGAGLLITSTLLAQSFTIPGNAAAYVPGPLEISPGVTLEIIGTLEIG